MRSIFLVLLCFLGMWSSAFAEDPVLHGRWQCHFTEDSQYLCEFRHGGFRVQLIPRYLEDHVDFRIIDGYVYDKDGKIEDGDKCSSKYNIYLGAFQDGLQYYLYSMSDMGNGFCQYYLSPQYDSDAIIGHNVNGGSYLNTNSIEYITKYIRYSAPFIFRIHDAHSGEEWSYVRVPFGNKKYLIDGLSYWRNHPVEARRLAKLHPVIRHSWHCGWQKDGRLLCDVMEQDMHVLLYPQPDGENVDAYIMTTLHSCPDNGVVVGFVNRKVYFAADNAGYNSLYGAGYQYLYPEDTRYFGVKWILELGGKYGCGYKLIPLANFPKGQSVVDVLSNNIMQYDMIYGNFDDGDIDAVPQGWMTGIELTDKAGLVHELQYWKHKKAEAKQADVKPTDVKPSMQGAY